MRSDMAKVIVERPRMGSRIHGKPKGYRRFVQRLTNEGLPFREGIKRRSRGGTKFLNEHLGPLRRFLDSQVGRPWNKVFAEICAHINRDSAVQDHVRDHVEDYVVTNVVMIDGVPCDGNGYARSYGQPLEYRSGWRRHLWFVCPRTGILRRARQRPKNAASGIKKPNLPIYVRLSATQQCRPIDGAWYLVTVTPLPLDPGTSKVTDVVLNRPVAEMTSHLAREKYGAAVYAVEKRRLPMRELGQFPIPMELWM